MENEIKIYEQGLEEYSKAGIIMGNLMMALWITLGTVAYWLFYPLVAWIYLTFAIVMVGIVLRRLVCTNRYYHNKWCCMGWGELSALFFKKGNIEKFAASIGLKFVPLFYHIYRI